VAFGGLWWLLPSAFCYRLSAILAPHKRGTRRLLYPAIRIIQRPGEHIRYSHAVRLRAEGVDVSSFHPSMLSNSDLSTSARVIAIGVELTPDSRQLAQTSVEEWNDIPPATLSYAATQQALKAHVERLVDELSKATASPRSSSAGK